MKKFLVCLALLLTSLAAAGCDVSSSTPQTSATSEPRVEKLKTNLSAEEARELAAPASSTPGLSVDAARAQSAASNSFETEAKGLVRTRLFDTATGSDNERFARLEAAVQALRDDYDTTAPAINRLMAIEQEIQGLVDQLQVLVNADAEPADLSAIPPVAVDEMPITDGGTPTTLPPVATPPVPAPPSLAPPVQVTPEPQAPVAAPAPAPTPTPPPAPAPQAAAPAPASSGASLVAARVADHNTTTRVVFETTGNIPYTADVDPEQILIVSFAGGSAAGNLSGASMKSSLVKSMDVTPQSNGGMIVAMPLSKNTRIVGQGVLKPDGANKNYRVYIDLAR